MLACMIPAAILSYGGINSFVIIFSVYPIALKLFEDADLPTYLLPGIVCGGMWTFAMTGPFTPQIPNIVSMQHPADAILCRAASRALQRSGNGGGYRALYEPGVQESQASGRTFSVA